jgi:ribosome-binding factor A
VASERRLAKLNIFLKEELASILSRESEIMEESFVTVTRVEVSRRLLHASVYLSILDTEPERILENLNKNAYHIQQILNKRLRMRPVPKISFLIDAQELRREKVEKHLAELKRKRGI